MSEEEMSEEAKERIDVEAKRAQYKSLDEMLKEIAGDEGFWKPYNEEELCGVFVYLVEEHFVKPVAAVQAIEAVWSIASTEYGD